MTTNSKNRIVFSKSDTMKFLEKKAGSPLTIATLLVAIRKSEEISQVDFADLLEISRSHLCDIEKKRKGLSPASRLEGTLAPRLKKSSCLSFHDKI